MMLINDSTVSEIVKTTDEFTEEQLLEEADFFAKNDAVQIVWDSEQKFPIPRIDCSMTPDDLRFGLPDNPEPWDAIAASLFEAHGDVLAQSTNRIGLDWRIEY